MSLELWTSDDAAAYLRMAPRYFNASIKPLPTFPRPRTLPVMVRGKLTRSRPLWLADEVRAWAAEHLEVSA